MNIDYLVVSIIDNKKLILIVIVTLTVVRIIIGYKKKFTIENNCPKCQISENERVPRSLFEKLAHLNIATKKYRCLKCWKSYYVRATLTQSN